MFSKFCLLGLCVAVGVSAAPSMVGPSKGVSFKLGVTARWAHTNVKLETRSQVKYKAGYVFAPRGFNGLSSHLNDPGIADNLFLRYFRQANELVGIASPASATYRLANGGAPELRVDNSDNAAARARHPQLRDAQVASTKAFLNTLEFGPVAQFSDSLPGGQGRVWDTGLSTNLSQPGDAANQAIWLFGFVDHFVHSADRETKPGALISAKDYAVSSSHRTEFTMDRPAVDLSAELAFALNPSLSLFVIGGYSFVFGDDHVDKDVQYKAVEGVDVKLKSLDADADAFTVKGGVAARAFDTSGGRILSDVKLVTSIKEGWRGFVGFTYKPVPSFFVSLGVGLKEYKVSVEAKEGKFYYPYSPFLPSHIFMKDEKSLYTLAMNSTVVHAKDVYGLAFRLNLGVVLAEMHSFSAGVEFVSTKADLDVSAKKESSKKDAADDKNKKAQLTQSLSAPLKPTDKLPDNVWGLGLNPDAHYHITPIEKIELIRTANIEIRDIAVSFSYQFIF